MIIANGTIQVLGKTAGGIDAATGFPVASTGKVWSDPIPCQWSPVTWNNFAYSNTGEPVVRCSFSVLVEWPLETAIGEQVRLNGQDGDVIGEYQVVSAERLQAVCQTKILI